MKPLRSMKPALLILTLFVAACDQTPPPPATKAPATKPADAKEGTWIQTTPGKGWFLVLRLYSPLESFFDKTWRPSEIELVK